ncbi:MAG: hypothetical protein L0211_02915 [Planctomycetaceae bacterium]|nr:hypothetical protein [Planctomycetaceae bacterium]
MSRPSLVAFRWSKSSRNPATRRRIFFEPLEERCVLAAPTITLGTAGGVFALDPTFDVDGLVRTDLVTSQDDSAWDTAVQADGKIIAVGQAAGASGMPDFAVVRYNVDGSKDLSFGGGDGVFTFNFAGQDVAKAVLIQPDGKIVVAGTAETIGTGGFNLGVIRLNDDGTLDMSFAPDGGSDFGGGALTVDFGGTLDFGDAAALQADGKIVVVGTSSSLSGTNKIGVVRIHSDGSLDTGFSGDGKQELDLIMTPGSTELAAGVVVQGDQKIVVASQISDENGINKAAITRLNSDGSPDGSFSGGTVITTFPAAPVSTIGGFVEAVALDGDKIVAAGTLLHDLNLEDFFVLRYNADGTPDNTFDGDGMVFSNFGTDSRDRAFDVVVQGGKIIVAGESDGGTGNDDFLVARYNSNGSLDTTFAPGGRIKTDFLINNLSKINGARSLALTPTGGIVLAGQLNHVNGTDFLLARYVQPPGNPPTFDPINENGSITLTGSYTTSSPLAATITINWGDGTSSSVPVTGGAAPFSASHTYLDDVPSGDPSNNNLITATIVDPEGADSESTSVIVNNVAPLAGALGGPSGGVRNQPLTFTGSFTDVGTLDTHSVIINWGDNTTSAAVINPVTRTFTASHEYASTGGFTLSYTLTDDDTGQVAVASAAAVNIAVAQLQPAPGLPGETALFIGGTGVGESISVTPATTSVEAFINGVSQGVFDPTAAVFIYAGSGDDDLQISGSIALSAWLFGGAGHDRMKGGAGSDVLLGQDGNDLLVGGAGRDILIGGLGADRIVGNADDDILISGTTSHDANIAALAAILAEWTSTRDWNARTANISGAGTGPRENGMFFLTALTVQDDGARDVMTGSSGFDWFFANLGSEDDASKDKITDLSAAEFAADLEFIGS